MRNEPPPRPRREEDSDDDRRHPRRGSPNDDDDDDDDDDDLPRKKKLSSKETYNLVTDTVTGPNLRWRDNLFQGIAIVVFALIGVLVAYFALDLGVVEKVLIGLIGGMVVGLFISGAAIAIYRAIRHASGKHD